MLRTRSNKNWLYDLRASGSVQEAAIGDLREILLRAALYFFSRNLSDFQGQTREEIMHRAEDCAQEATISVLNHLSDFRGDSKFTTWAYKFAINISLMAARRERWKGVPLDALASSDEGNFLDSLMQEVSDVVTPEKSALQVEVQTILQDVIEQDLTDKQRRVLVLMVLDEVLLDEVVRHLGTNRNAVYKMLHDARRKLKNGLKEHGFDSSEMFALFGSGR
jgi:RNA polymerase sigma-70 factor, ECF subfamily